MFDEPDYDRQQEAFVDASDFIVDIREYDVPYHVRVAIDKGEHLTRLGAC
jgi:DNA polymerase epsilon subunit 1